MFWWVFTFVRVVLLQWPVWFAIVLLVSCILWLLITAVHLVCERSFECLKRHTVAGMPRAFAGFCNNHIFVNKNEMLEKLSWVLSVKEVWFTLLCEWCRNPVPICILWIVTVSDRKQQRNRSMQFRQCFVVPWHCHCILALFWHDMWVSCVKKMVSCVLNCVTAW